MVHFSVHNDPAALWYIHNIQWIATPLPPSRFNGFTIKVKHLYHKTYRFLFLHPTNKTRVQVYQQCNLWPFHLTYSLLISGSMKYSGIEFLKKKHFPQFLLKPSIKIWLRRFCNSILLEAFRSTAGKTRNANGRTEVESLIIFFLMRTPEARMTVGLIIGYVRRLCTELLRT